MKKEVIVSLNNVLSGASMSKLASTDKCRVLDILRSFRPEVKDWNESIKETQEKVKAEQLTEAEANAWLNEKAKEDIEVKIPGKLSKDAFEKLMESNESWSAGMFLLIEEHLVGDK